MRKAALPIFSLAIGFFSAAIARAADPVPTVNVSTAAAAAPTPPPVTAPPATMPPPPVPATAAPRPSGLNELKGKFQSKNDDPMAFRIMVDGGYNVEFAYDTKTVMINGGNPITANDLNYGDVLVVHYSGKELYAVDIDRVSKAQ